MRGTDAELLEEFVRDNSEDAFRRIVEQYTPLVYGAACRQLRDHHLCQDAVQATFVVLAQKASTLGRDTVLASWLWRTASFISMHLQREELRRKRREALATMATTVSSAAADRAEDAWKSIRPLLDKALASLPAKARDAVVAHFLAGKPLRELASQWGIRQNAAAMRVNYGVKKLRERFAALGVRISGAMLVTFLGTKTSAAAPAGLTASAHATAIASLAGASAEGPAVALAHTAMKLMLWSKVKSAAVWAAAAVVVGVGAYPVAKGVIPRAPEPASAVTVSPEVAAQPPAPRRAEAKSRGPHDRLVPRHVNPEAFHPGYYMVAGRYEPRSFEVVRNEPHFEGVVKYYWWREIEPEEGRYDFSEIERDLQSAAELRKRVWIKPSYWWSGKNESTPRYMWEDPRYGGTPPHHGNIIARDGKMRPALWNEHVQARLSELYATLGRRFGGVTHVEGVMLEGTSGGRGPGFSARGAEEGFRTIALAARRAFPEQIVIQEMDSAPWDLASFARWLAENGSGIAGTSVRPATMTDVSSFLRQHHDLVATAAQVRWYDYDATAGETGRPLGMEAVLQGMIEKTDPWYLFVVQRGPREFREQILPAVHRCGLLPAVRRLKERRLNGQ